MAITKNASGVAHARTLIQQGKIDHGDFNEAGVDRSEKNKDAFLGVDDSAKPDTEAHWKFPVVVDGKVNSRAVGNAITRAESNGHGEVAAAARELSDLIAKHADGPKEQMDAADGDGPDDEGAGDMDMSAASSVSGLISLRSGLGMSGVKVDRDNHAIRNVAVMSAGLAKKHGFEIDNTMLGQVADQMKNGVAMRFKHPAQRLPDGSVVQTDSLGTHVGRVVNPRMDPATKQVRGDIVFGKHAQNVPGLGNVEDYLMSLAEEDPSAYGLSAVFDPGTFVNRRDNVPLGRSKNVVACDLTSDPAANRMGLLSTATAPVSQQVGEKLLQLLINLSQTAAGASPAAPSLSQGAGPMDPVSNPTQPPATPAPATPAAAPAVPTAPVSLSTDQAKAIRDAAATLGVDSESVTRMLSSLGVPASAPRLDPDAEAVDRDRRLIALEAKRCSDLRMLSSLYKLDEAWVQEQISLGADVPTAKQNALAALSKKNKAPTDQGSDIRVGADANLVSLSACLGDAIRLRAGAKIEKPHERAARIQYLSFVDMGRQYLSAIGYKEAFEIGRSKVVDLLVSPSSLRREPGGGQMVMLAESVGDFPGILADTINKSLLQAYRDAAPSWTVWARRATAPDFKTITRAALSESPDMKNRDAGDSIKYVTMSDTKETYSLTEYIGGIKLTRRALINDDLDAFSRIPMLQGNAAARKEDDVAYNVLTANAAMIVDSTALFHANHKNLDGSGAAPNIAQLQSGYAKMRTQKGPAGAARLNILPKYIMVPVAIEAGTLQLINSTQLLPVVSTTSSAPQTVGAANPYANRLQVISNPRLDDNSATAWYLAADYRDGQVDTVEVCFLQDEPEPVLRQETDFDTEDQKFAVRHTVAAKAIDFRGLYKNAGA